MKTKMILFANDIKICTKVAALSDYIIIQFELNIFSEWIKRFGLTLNVNKCNVMFFTRSRSSLYYDYFLNDTLL